MEEVNVKACGTSNRNWIQGKQHVD